jgi:hypothetical protein
LGLTCISSEIIAIKFDDVELRCRNWVCSVAPANFILAMIASPPGGGLPIISARTDDDDRTARREPISQQSNPGNAVPIATRCVRNVGKPDAVKRGSMQAGKEPATAEKRRTDARRRVRGPMCRG